MAARFDRFFRSDHRTPPLHRVSGLDAASFVSGRPPEPLRALSALAGDRASLLFLASFAAAQAQSTVGGRGESRPQQLQGETSLPVYVARTDSPRATLSSFLRLRGQFEEAARAYWEKHDRSNAERALLIADEFTSLIDLSEVPAASRRAIGAETGGYLLDIFGRVPLPNLDDVPDVADLGADGSAAYDSRHTLPDRPDRRWSARR